MEQELGFVISGEPTAQGRPRFSRQGNFVRAYDPKKSKDAKQTVRYFATQAMNESELDRPLEGPLIFKAQFGIGMPKSEARKRIPRPRIWRTKKPDLDNLLKLVKDACSSVVYLDDNQIVRVVAEKIQCAQGEAPFTKVLFRELKPLD